MKKCDKLLRKKTSSKLYRLTNPERKISVFICVHLWLIFLCVSTHAQTIAPGAPGKDAQWATAGKQAIGTSASLESKVWFTLAEGAMTEVYYPDVTMANVHKLEFVVVNPKTKKVETETADAIHQIFPTGYKKDEIGVQIPGKQVPESLDFIQVNKAKSGDWTIYKTYTVDVERSTVLIKVLFASKVEGLKFYVYYDPSLANTGMKDTAWNEGQTLLAQDGSTVSALISDGSFDEISSGFYQTSDGLEQLRANGKIGKTFTRAENGNVAQIAGLAKPKASSVKMPGGFESYEFALGFGKNPSEAKQNAALSLSKGFTKCQTEYQKGWSDYVKTLPKVEPKYQAQFNMAAMVLKAQEDKTVRGANVASLTIPWGGGKNANEDIGGGYHLVWSRDLYQVVTAYMALGDTAAANRALDFLFNIQQKPDGSFPQNSWLDGKKGWGSLQLDEVAYPLILAHQLKRFDKQTYENHIKKAADFLVKTGPKTPQERWEEKSGYSPSTIAAEIAGLVCAADIAQKNGDNESANLWLKTADDWQANVEKWTATTNGKYGDGNYYVRLTENGKPDANEKTVLNNNAGTFQENEIVDAGFLELVRLGVKSPDDPLIVKSLRVVDKILRVSTPNGDSFYRYNHDGYGEMDDGRRWNFDGNYTGKGRLWALLAGERGEYQIALSAYYKQTEKPLNKNIKGLVITLPQMLLLGAKERYLDTMLNFANEGLMIPEQIWDKPEMPANIDKQFVPELKFGEGTGSATPLAWSMAQFIRLAVNLQAGRNLETPDVVYNRYVAKKNSQVNPQTSKMNPIISNGNAVFNYPGEGNDIEFVGDMTGWQAKNLKFENGKIAVPFAPTARVEYKFIVDGQWTNDPLNPNKIDNGVGGENSFFTMPDYKPTIWDKDTNLPTTVTAVEIDSKIYGKRTVKVYQPFFKSAKPSLPVLYLQDGTDYINRAKAIQIQQNLVAAGKIKPFIMVFVDYKDRMKEYWASDDYAKFLAEEVVPVIDEKFDTIKSRDGRAILGASLGGVTSVHTALKYPEVFERVGGQSSSFWIDNQRVINELGNLDGKTNFKFYLDTGTLEGADDDRKAVGILKTKGFEVTYEEAEAGHNWTSWRDRLADAYVALWK